MGAVLFSPLHFPRLLGWRALGFFALFVAAISAWAWSGVLLTTQVVPFDEMLEYYISILQRNTFTYAPIYLAVAIVDGLPLRGRSRTALLIAAPVVGALLAVQVRCLAAPDQLVYVYGSMKLPYCDAFPTWRSYVGFPNSWITPLTIAGLVMAFVFAMRRDAELVGALSAASAAQIEARRQFVESEIEAVRSRVDPDRLRETLRAIRDRYEVAPVEAESQLDELIAGLRRAAGRPATVGGAA
jgi:hypothetical protein